LCISAGPEAHLPANRRRKGQAQMTFAKLGEPSGRLGSARVMLYSHDTFGLGHLRRSRALAQAITSADRSASALILTGSPVAGRFDFPCHVDHFRLPGVTKLRDGSYVSKSMGMTIEETTELRTGLIRSAIAEYEPDVLIVDKEPCGFRGELLPALEDLQRAGHARMVLGLRDVLDEPDVLRTEWQRKNAIAATERFYDEIWIYGTRAIYDPVAGLPLSEATRKRIHWTGYLRREVHHTIDIPDERYILVTPGGGGDGQAMVDLVLSAYEKDPELQPKAKLVYGPFLSGELRAEFEARVAALAGRVSAVGFDSQIEALYAGAEGVVCMGGYNTFCEVLSFDKRALIVPRTVPRLEQYIRAKRAEELGLIHMLDEYRDGLTPEAMIEGIRNLPRQRTPSDAVGHAAMNDLLSGLDYVTGRVAKLLAHDREQAVQ
jgi:predicted glycosyltransferase